MKSIKFKFSFAVLIALVAVSSCSKIDDFGNLNQNPGGSTEPVPSGLLTNVISQMGNNYVWGGNIVLNSGLYTQYFSETQYTEASRYAKQQPDFDGFYSGNLYDLQNIINYASNENTAGKAAQYGSVNNQIAVARILKAYIFWFLTDEYGDIPYFDALKGDFGITKYDPQQEIYTDLFKELTEAVAQFDDGTPAQGDILFNGDISMWKKFANSIRAIMALRISKADASKGQSEFNAALNAGVFESGDAANIDYPGGNFPNPIYNYYVLVQRRDYAVAETMTGWLSALNDPRINAYASSDVGFPYGLDRDDAIAFSNANTNWARVFQGVNTPDTKPLSLMMAAEVYLARSEAASLGWTSENVADMYRMGIQESFSYWNVDQSSFDTYMADPNVALESNTDIEKIATQEWLAHYPNGWQGWSSWRRTGYPNLEPAPDQPNPIPVRMAYGLNEYSYNPSNVAAAGAKYTAADGPNSQFSPVWWDK